MASTAPLQRFFKVFVSNFSSDSMMIPASYYDELPSRLPESAILQGTGGCFWSVAMMKKQDEVYFGQGWSKFVVDNHLIDGDILSFVYDGDHIFEVSIYGSSGGGCKETRDVAEIINFQEDSVCSLSSGDVNTSPEPEMTKKTVPRSRNKGMSKIKNPEVYLDNPENAHFETRLKNRKFELFVPGEIVRDYCLKFQDFVSFIDNHKDGELEAKTVQWSDQRVCIKKWHRICERNNVKKEDAILCELLCKQNVVYAVKIQIIREKDL